MNSTSRSSRLVSNAARSPAFAITGPEVARKPTPNSRATICASVVLPRPGGPTNSTWSSASPRLRAASMKTARLARACCWPTNSDKSCGRSAVSPPSSLRRSGVTMREGVVMLERYLEARAARPALGLPSPWRGRDERSSLLGVGGGGPLGDRRRGYPPTPTLPRRKSGLPDFRKIKMRNRGRPRLRGEGAHLRFRDTPLLIGTQDVVELVVVLDDEIDVALVLDLRLRRLERRIEVGERLLLVVGGYLLVGLDLRDLRLDDGLGADILLGRGIDAAHHQGDVVDHIVVFVEACKAVLFRDAFELRHHLGVRLGVVGQFVGDRIHLLLRGEDAVDLLVGQRDLLQLRRLSGLRRGCRVLGLVLGLRQRAAGGERRERGSKAGNAQGGNNGTNQRSHGNLLKVGRFEFTGKTAYE